MPTKNSSDLVNCFLEGQKFSNEEVCPREAHTSVRFSTEADHLGTKRSQIRDDETHVRPQRDHRKPSLGLGFTFKPKRDHHRPERTNTIAERLTADIRGTSVGPKRYISCLGGYISDLIPSSGPFTHLI